MVFFEIISQASYQYYIIKMLSVENKCSYFLGPHYFVTTRPYLWMTIKSVCNNKKSLILLMLIAQWPFDSFFMMFKASSLFDSVFSVHDVDVRGPRLKETQLKVKKQL